jgi:hypothetical protein
MVGVPALLTPGIHMQAAISEQVPDCNGTLGYALYPIDNTLGKYSQELTRFLCRGVTRESSRKGMGWLRVWQDMADGGWAGRDRRFTR